MIYLIIITTIIFISTGMIHYSDYDNITTNAVITNADTTFAVTTNELVLPTTVREYGPLNWYSGSRITYKSWCILARAMLFRPPGTVVPGGLVFCCGLFVCYFLALCGAISTRRFARSLWNFHILYNCKCGHLEIFGPNYGASASPPPTISGANGLGA